MAKHLQTGSLKTINGETLEGTGNITTVVELKTGIWTDSGKRWNGKKVEWIIIAAGALPSGASKFVPIPDFDNSKYIYKVNLAESYTLYPIYRSVPVSFYNDYYRNGLGVYIELTTGEVAIITRANWTGYDETYIVVERMPK